MALEDPFLNYEFLLPQSGAAKHREGQCVVQDKEQSKVRARLKTS